MADYRRRNVTNSRDAEYRPGSGGAARNGSEAGRPGQRRSTGSRGNGRRAAGTGSGRIGSQTGRRTAGTNGSRNAGSGTANGTGNRYTEANGRGTAGTGQIGRAAAGRNGAGTGNTAAGRNGAGTGYRSTAGTGRTTPSQTRSSGRMPVMRTSPANSRLNNRPETEAERQTRLQKEKRKKELLAQKRRRKQIMKYVQFGAIGIAVLLIIILAVVFGVKRSKAKKAEEEAALAAAHAAATQTVMQASDVLHLSFPVLTQDDSPLAQAVGLGSGEKQAMVDEDGDGFPDEETMTEDGSENPEWLPEGFEETDGDEEGELDEEAAEASAGALEIITVSQFNKILQDLYDRDYVLVDIYSLATFTENGMEPGKVSVPKGKKPLIISQRDVSYEEGFNGHPDRLVMDGNGRVTCEYTIADGSVKRGDVDVIPCLEAFIDAHPDFSFEGARGVIGVTGYRGVFGYQIEKDLRIIGTIDEAIANSEKRAQGTAANTTTDMSGAAGGEENYSGDGYSEYDDGEDYYAEEEYTDYTGNEYREPLRTEDNESAEPADALTEDTEGADSGKADEQPAGSEARDASEAEKQSEAAVEAGRRSASTLVSTLSEKGWRFASNSYGLISYGSEYEKTTADAALWKEKLAPIVGDTDILLLPKGADLDAWSGYQADNRKFNYLKDMGFKYYCAANDGAFTWVQIRPDYVRMGMHDICTQKQYETLMNSEKA